MISGVVLEEKMKQKSEMMGPGHANNIKIVFA
jgi:hypothetical protein